MTRRQVFIATTLSLAAGVFHGVGSAPQVRLGRRGAPVTHRGTDPMANEARPGLVFRLSEGQDEAQPQARSPVAPAVLLDEAGTKRLLERLPAIEAPPEDEQAFALREKSLPVPRTGRTISAMFPPAAERSAPNAADAGPLEVLRRTPEGDVPVAPNLAVTFSEPMVAVTSHTLLTAEARPVQLLPEPPGQWRWVGTKTLLFEPAGRFPMATDYKVEAPAGTRAAGGGVLAKAVAWTFSTPPPTLLASHPVGGPARRDPLLFVAFDQKVEPRAVIGGIEIRAAGQTFHARLATAEEVLADDTVKAFTQRIEPGRSLAFRPEAALPADAEVTVTVPAGTPSAEGPKKTTKAQEWRFRTFGPMRVKSHRCGYKDQCPPYTPWQVEFTNPVDAKAFRKEMVRVKPEVPGLKVEVYGQNLSIHGASKGRTRYTVTLVAAIPDAFGQTLEEPGIVTFDVGPARPSLFAPGGNLVVLDPVAAPRFSVYSINHPALRVRASSVTPEDWPAFQKFMQSRGDDKAPPPGRSVLDTTVKVQGRPDELTETRIDLSPALQNGLGQLVLRVDAVIPPDVSNNTVTVRSSPPTVRAWVQATKIGLDAFADDRDLLGWATSLADGRPLGEVALGLVPGGAVVDTAASGLATLPLTDASTAVLVGRRGGDVAILPASASWWGQGWKRQMLGDELRFYIVDDRQMYRPGEDVQLKGWVRRVGMGREGDVAEAAGLQQVSYVLKDSRGNEMGKGTCPLRALGGFDLVLKLPPNMNLGPAQLEITAPGGLAHHAFQVQEFRRPEFEVTARASEGPFVVGDHATVALSASYYAGGGLANADTAWSVTATPASFTPPNRDDFVFGLWVPWWRAGSGAEDSGHTLTQAGRTDAAGSHLLRIDFDRADPPRPSRVVAEASVMDVNRQAWAASTELLVHPSSLYVGLKTARAFVEKGQPLHVDVIVTDLDGKAIGGHDVGVRAERLEWEQEAGEWKEKVAGTQECATVSAMETVRCTFTSAEGGVYRIRARVADDRGRPNESEMRVWVAGGKTAPHRGVEQEEATLVPNGKAYKAGDVAEVLVVTPFLPAEGLVTVRRSGILRTARFTMVEPSHILRIPIEDGWTPNVHLQVDLVGTAARANVAGEPDARLRPRPAFASGSLSLPVPPRARTLALQAIPRDKALAPGGETVLDVSVRDADGRPVAGADVAVAVVDEAVLALTGYRFPDPLAVFYPSRPTGVTDVHSRASLLLARPDEIAPDEGARTRLQGLGYLGSTMDLAASAQAMAPPAPMAMARARMAAPSGRGESAPEPIRVRSDFNALALFAASLPTDGQGNAQVKIRVPDNLTRYRVMAVAAAGARQFGYGESTLTARMPLMVRPSAPRFLNFGDRFELPVVLQNQTDTAMSVAVAVRATNALLTAGAGRRVQVPANDRVEVRFPAAAQRAGKARFQIGAAAGSWSDAAEVQLPVWTPATTEAFATYGQIDEGAVSQPVEAPAHVVSSFGGLEVTTSSTALQALTDAVLYLVAYPFECAEQLSSRVLAVAALKDVLGAFQAEGLPPPEEMTSAVKRDLERLRSLQNDDGGFAFWRRGDESWPYVSIHAAHALERARAKGFAVPEAMLQRSREYLKAVESRISREYHEDTRRTLLAYALYVRHRLGEPDPLRARRLVQEAGLDGLSFEAVGWLLPVLSSDPGSATEVAQIRRYLANHTTETAATAHFAVSYGEGAHLILHSDRRADAVLLEALIGDQPKSDLIPKLVEGLLGHRRAGRWENTQENAFVLLALDRYFGTYEKATPDFLARTWLGARYAGEHAFRGRTTERHHLEIPMRTLSETTRPLDLTLVKNGPGRLYYRIGMKYAPDSLKLEAADHGFAVERRYEGVDRPDDVRRGIDGSWRVRAGSKVRVQLTMVATSRRYHVALVDPLPAGLEASNPALRVTGSVREQPDETVEVMGAPGLGGPRLAGAWWWWNRPWFEHQNLRDERVEAFASLLFEGVYTYSYVARATTPGTFVVPPPRAEEMYHPETFGRGASDRVVVE
jgi:alpha-2-macroglobulin